MTLLRKRKVHKSDDKICYFSINITQFLSQKHPLIQKINVATIDYIKVPITTNGNHFSRKYTFRDNLQLFIFAWKKVKPIQYSLFTNSTSISSILYKPEHFAVPKFRKGAATFLFILSFDFCLVKHSFGNSAIPNTALDIWWKFSKKKKLNFKSSQKSFLWLFYIHLFEIN